MSDLPAKLRPVADKLRGLKAKLGLAVYSVSVRIRESNADNDGFVSDVSFPLQTGGYPAPVRQLSQRVVALSGGLYQDQDLELTVTPAFDSGGYLFAALDPELDASSREILFIVTGDGLPASGALFKKVSVRVDSLAYRIVIRNTGATP